MNPQEKNIGTIAAVTALVSFIVYTVCFILILLVNEPFVWSDIYSLATYEASNQTAMKYIAMVCMIVFALAYETMIICMTKKTQTITLSLQPLPSFLEECSAL